MKLIIQRVKSACVLVDGEKIASIGRGALVLAGVETGDKQEDILHLARKTSALRIFDDEEGKMNAPISAIEGSFLVVSQFTLLADCRKGNRPGYTDAAVPEEAIPALDLYVATLQDMGHEVQQGKFGAHMNVQLDNDGPVTIMLESHGRGA